MKKVLIIDDDALVRMFLKQIISWESEGYTIVEEARDGEEGVQIFDNIYPDLLIVDVSMPIMNGIEFIEKIRRKNYSGGIIMLSCHDDFDYVKTAMSIGADEYVLKNHLNPTILLETLHEVEKKVSQRVQETSQQDKLRTYAQKGMLETKKEVLLKILHGEVETLDEQKLLLESARIDGSFYDCATILVHLPKEHQDKKGRFYELCQQISLANTIEVLMLEERIAAFVIDLTECPSIKRRQNLLSDIQKKINNYVWEYLGIHISNGSSDVCTGEGAMPKAVKQAKRALALDFYEQGVWKYSDYQKMAEKCPINVDTLITELPYLIKLGDEEKLRSTWAASITRITEQKVRPQVAREWLRRCDLAIEIVREEEEYISLETIGQLSDCVELYIVHLHSGLVDRTPENVSLTIENAVSYINKYFPTNCSLGEVADYIGLTPTYLSARFKQEMKMGFVEYVTEVRIGKAKWLLQSQKYDSIRSISEESGFTDYQHFCKVFRKKVGVSPSEFRKKILGGHRM